MTRRRKVGLASVLVVLVLAGVLYWRTREPSPDTRFNGAYRLADGGLALVVPQRGEALRLIVPAEGERRPLQPAGELRYRVGSAGTPVPPERQPDEEILFRLDDAGRPLGFLRHRGEAGALAAERIELREELLTLASDGHALRAKLVLPPAAGADGERFSPPYPAAVIVHGSGKESAVDFFDKPYLFAPSGIATLVYDKRGTGGSEGTYTQNFHVLARDVLAAVAELRRRPEIDPKAIHLVGFSQGGWIAPLAASRTSGIASLVVGYGPMVPVVDEDRWGYVYTLRKKGLEEAIPEADRIHELLVAIIDHKEKGRWDELATALDAAEGEAWFDAVADSDSAVGFLSANRWVPIWALRLYARWMLRDIEGEAAVDRLYDPVPVVTALDVPSLWIFGGDDHSMPTEWTLRELRRLEQQGAPIEVVVYPEADHGIVLYDTSGEQRRFVGYPPSYMPTMVDWLLRHSRGRTELATRGPETTGDTASMEVEASPER
jgi:uncharacterized protein